MRLCLFRISARVRLNVRRGSLPAYFNLDEAVCIAGCNEDLNYTLGIRCAVSGFSALFLLIICSCYISSTAQFLNGVNLASNAMPYEKQLRKKCFKRNHLGHVEHK